MAKPLQKFASLLMVLLCISPLLGGCTAGQSERCKDSCQRETECAEQRSSEGENFPYDLDECVAACMALERDGEGRKLVDSHVECVKKAGDNCSVLMSCR